MDQFAFPFTISMKGSLHRHFKFEVMGVCCEKDEPVEVAAIVVRPQHHSRHDEQLDRS